MFKKIILVSSILPFLAQAQVAEQVLQKIEKVNSAAPGVSPCFDCGNTEIEKVSTFGACVRELCTDKNHFDYDVIATKLEKESSGTQVRGEAEVEKKLQEIMAIRQGADNPETRKKIYDLLKKSEFDMSDESLEMAFQLMAVTLSSAALKPDAKGERVIMDEDKFEKIKLPFSSQNKAALKKRLQGVVASFPPIAELSDGVLINSETYLKEKYPGLTSTEALQKMAADAKAEYEIFKKTRMARFFLDSFDVASFYPAEMIQNIESGRDLSEMVVRDFIAEIRGMEVTRKLFAGDLVDGKDIDYSEIRKHFVRPALIDKTIAFLKQDEARTKKENEDGLAGCMGVYRRNMKVLPNAQQAKALKDSVQEVKNRVAQGWAPKYSVQTQKGIEDYLKKVDFVLPLSKDEFQEGFKEKLRLKLLAKQRDSKLEIRNFSTLALIFLVTEFNKEIVAIAKPESAAAKDMSSNEYLKMCDREKVKTLSDANYTLLGKIRLSYTSAQALDLGKGVIAHELGHGISRIFRDKKASDHSSKKHAEFIKCLGGLHSKNGEHYHEEDYADWVAGNVTSVNMACIFPQNYRSSGSLLENVDESDPHSDDFFRLLHIESLQRAKLPKACNKVLAREKTSVDFESCQRLLK